jgi:hypothetical protein
MGDPSVEVSHDASQEAEGVVMEAILRRYYCFSLSTSSDQAIFRFLIYVYFCLFLVKESGRSCSSSQHRNAAESELSN